MRIEDQHLEEWAEEYRIQCGENKLLRRPDGSLMTFEAYVSLKQSAKLIEDMTAMLPDR